MLVSDKWMEANAYMYFNRKAKVRERKIGTFERRSFKED